VTVTDPSLLDPPDGWVPVEQRWFGLDRRQLKPAIAVLLIGLFLATGLPAINAAIPWHNETHAGDKIDLGDGATVVPPVGWQLQDGSLVGAAGITGVSPGSVRVVLAHGGAVIQVRGGTFAGSAEAFLDQVLRNDGQNDLAMSGAQAALTTDAGRVGVVETGSGPSGDTLWAAFKMATGTSAAVNAAPPLLVEARTAPGQLTQYQDEITAFLRSVTPGEAK
jgi:hypothetical protein